MIILDLLEKTIGNEYLQDTNYKELELIIIENEEISKQPHANKIVNLI